ncbi:MAG TPA: type II toxin-antitoxin system RelE/ParE family toxin [Terriglobales bacterium]|nr:type II toxin-antitoxin system RelE/ParE family toxin [Terriglobales bacterium]
MPDRAVELHREAAAEFDSAFDWYLERSPDAARKFDAEVDRALTQILRAPQRWAAGPHNTRKFLLRQFPFTLIYRERALGDIQVVAVAHTSRKPGYWKRRR